VPSPTFGVTDEHLDRLGLEVALRSPLSIREISRQSGVPYSTLQNILQVGGPDPSERTRARLEAWAESGPVYTQRRTSTWVTDSDFWSESKLGNLRPPAGATHFRLVVSSDDSPTGVVSTPWDELRSLSPSDQAFGLGLDARNIRRVVWTRAGSLPNVP
jgi:hypothetical protein